MPYPVGTNPRKHSLGSETLHAALLKHAAQAKGAVLTNVHTQDYVYPGGSSIAFAHIQDDQSNLLLFTPQSDTKQSIDLENALATYQVWAKANPAAAKNAKLIIPIGERRSIFLRRTQHQTMLTIDAASGKATLHNSKGWIRTKLYSYKSIRNTCKENGFSFRTKGHADQSFFNPSQCGFFAYAYAKKFMADEPVKYDNSWMVTRTIKNIVKDLLFFIKFARRSLDSVGKEIAKLTANNAETTATDKTVSLENDNVVEGKPIVAPTPTLVGLVDDWNDVVPEPKTTVSANPMASKAAATNKADENSPDSESSTTATPQ